VIDEPERVALNTRIEQQNELLDKLTHDLRSPLHAILGWVALLKASPGDPHTRERGLETIERNARVQQHLLDEIVDTLHVLRGEVVLRPAPIDPRAIVMTAVEALQPVAQARGVHLEAALAHAPTSAQADGVRLQRLIAALLAHAVRTAVVGSSVEITASADSSRFEIQVRGGAAPSPEEAHGVGLAVAHQLATLHGGVLSIERVVGVSAADPAIAVFRARLPLGALGRT